VKTRQSFPLSSINNNTDLDFLAINFEAH
jgi:hypothetical protein